MRMSSASSKANGKAPLVRDMKLALQVMAFIFLVFAIIAGLSSAREWIVLKQFSGYQKDLFTVESTKVVHGNNDGTDYYLRGHGEHDAYEFAISAARYETFRSPTMVGRQVAVFRNPALPSLSFQTESVNVIFEEDWRDRALVEVSAKSTLWIAGLSMVLAILGFSLIRVFFKAHQG
ncbi:hypothetical protein BGE01nite_05750 [Brevifollis gellanilyticus]|uniref:DUF3592 domain-containing protein n=2 Tax=Brevifollis gellanilyticus TaxID=748831 RepID=A0A512M3G4_9BACT|nr:hypothetical protein BGE01nite_05750 [Brevifollis gellanilyticus]